MEQHKPATNALTNIISTDEAKTVNIQATEYGRDVTIITRFRPNRIAIPPNIPPNSAPEIKKNGNCIYGQKKCFCVIAT